MPQCSTSDDSGQQTSLTYPDGEVLSLGRDTASDWLTSAVTTPSGGSATNLLTNISYSGLAGAAQHPTGATVAGGTYSYGASYDNDLRLSSTRLTRVSDSTTLFGSARQYDAVGNVTSVSTTLAAGSGGTDNQAFCYDDLYRLTWASSATSGSTPCGGTNSAGTLTTGGAPYTQSFSYDTLGRLTSGPLGSYTYGDPAHGHAATSIGSGSTQYTASYDAAGDMLCRAPTGATTCASGQTPSGAQLSYDAEGRLVGWQNSPGATPTSTASFAYDGEGNRVAAVSSTSATTYYLGGWEEITGSTVTKYYPLGVVGLPQPVKVGSSISYLATDGLGSIAEAVDGAGNVLAQQLYAPYGGVRYSSGTLPTSKGFTGQRADAATGLDYFNARYYDPLAGQFTSADTVLAGKGYDLWGLSRYAYVEGNPETRVDTDGHCWPFCAIVAAVAVAVVATVVDVAVQAVQNNGDLSKTNWGQALTVGAVAGVATGATLLAGPAALEALGVAGGETTLGGSISAVVAAKASTSVGSAVVGGILGGTEGLIQGIQAGHRGGRLFADMGVGTVSGTAGGFIGGFIGNPVLGNMAANGIANFSSQALTATVDHKGRFNSGSFGFALGAGAIGGYSTRGLEPTNPAQFVLPSGVVAGGDFVSQYVYYNTTGQGSADQGAIPQSGSVTHVRGYRPW